MPTSPRVAFWSVILTIKYKIIFAYLVLLIPLFIVSGVSGNVLTVRSPALLLSLFALVALFALSLGCGDGEIAWPSHLTTCVGH